MIPTVKVCVSIWFVMRPRSSWLGCGERAGSFWPNRRAGVAARPERALRPAALLRVVVVQGCPIRGELRPHERRVAAQTIVIAAFQMIRNRVGGEHARAQCLEDPLPRHR